MSNQSLITGRLVKTWSIAIIVMVISIVPTAKVHAAEFRAGAAVADITPTKWPMFLVGNFDLRPATQAWDRLHARALVLDDGTTRIVFVVIDSCYVPRALLDDAKQRLERSTGIPTAQMLMSATHTHSAPASRDRRGLKADPEYVEWVTQGIVDAVELSVENLEPAEIGWGTAPVPDQVFNRRWYMKPGGVVENPFGEITDQVRMNPPRGSALLDRPAGPTDPDVTFISVRSTAGRPIGLLANYSLHYVGGVMRGGVSADYFGEFARQIQSRVADDVGTDQPPFVGIMSNGTSGDINNINFQSPRPQQEPFEQIKRVASEVADAVAASMSKLKYRQSVTMDMAQSVIPIALRRPTAAQIEFAKKALAEPDEGKLPKRAKAYAAWVMKLADGPAQEELVLQTLRIDELGIAAIPCEVFCEIGLEIKAKAPTETTFTIELANGHYGYLPTPRQHRLGGYETWLGTNILETTASDKITKEIFSLFDSLDVKRSSSRSGQDADQSDAGIKKSRSDEGDLTDDRQAAAQASNKPLEPRQALSSFQISDGLRLELVASEPAVVDPVAMAFDAAGRLWVVEMRDYPNGPAEGEAPTSRIKVLEDKDGDRYFESSTIFADQLLFANGILPWRGGVIVTMAGEVAWMKDLDGDLKSDVQEKWFSGFAQENPQLRANDPTLGLDGMVYVANGLRGGEVVAVRPGWSDDAKPVSISRMDFRFDPFTGRYNAVSGNGQFGLTFDDGGNRFICSNRNPCMHVVLENDKLQLNPRFAAPSVTADVSPAGADSHVYAISRPWTTSTQHAGQFTAACGVTIFRGTGLGKAYDGNSFTCEPTGNLVHRDLLKSTGPTWRSVTPDTPAEFLASRDTWFRPVNLGHGPDGALYVVDMYRNVIEHPQFMPVELKTRPDLEMGKDRGRIYRVVADRPAPGQPGEQERLIPLDTLSSSELIATLDHENGWQRETAYRLLLERQDSALAPELRRAATTAATAQGRLLSFSLLVALNESELEDVRLALIDPSPLVRAFAITRMPASYQWEPLIQLQLTELTEDDDARVRFEAALALAGPKVFSGRFAALAEMAVRDSGDPWALTAIKIASYQQPQVILQMLLHTLGDQPEKISPELSQLAGYLAERAAQETDELDVGRVVAALEPLTSEQPGVLLLQVDVLTGLAAGISRGGEGLFGSESALDEEGRKQVDAIVDRAVESALDDHGKLEHRIDAAEMLRYIGLDRAMSPLAALVDRHQPTPLRIKGVEILGSYGKVDLATLLMPGLRSETPAMRRAVISALLTRTETTEALLAAIEEGSIRLGELNPAQLNRLKSHRVKTIKERTLALVKEDSSTDRVKMLAAYQSALELKANPQHGIAVFKSHCATCHRIGKDGTQVGPDIEDSRTKTPEQLLASIIDPNQAIDNSYYGYLVQTVDGQLLSGIITAETPTSITIRQQENKEVSLLKTEIEEMKSSGMSLMPEGLEKEISVQQMADLISFIKNWRYLEEGIPVEFQP